MLLLTIVTLCLLVLVNYRIGAQALVFPPFAFCLVWVADLLVVWFVGDFFYPLSPETLLIFLGGCMAFSLGSWLALSWPMRASQESRPFGRRSSLLLTLLVILLVVSIPFCYRWMTQFSSGYGSNLLIAARLAMLDQGNEVDTGSVVFNNLVSLSIAVAMIAYLEKQRARLRAVAAIVASLVLNVLTGGRAGIASLLFAIVCLEWLITRRIRWKPVAVLALIFVVTFSGVAIYVGKAGARANATLSENMEPILEGFVIYGAGGLIAYDRVVRDPGIVPHNWNIDRFFLQAINRFGARVEVPDLHAEYVAIGPDSDTQNVYTMYFAYLDYGFLGTMALLVLLGLVTTLFYRKALAGSRIAALLYSTLFAGLLVSIFNEGLFSNLNFLIKLSLLAWALYSFPALWKRIAGLLKRSADAALAVHPHSES